MANVMQLKGLTTLLSMSRVPRSLVSSLMKPLDMMWYHTKPVDYPRMPARNDFEPLQPSHRMRVSSARWHARNSREFEDCVEFEDSPKFEDHTSKDFNLPAFIEARKACLKDQLDKKAPGLDLTFYNPKNRSKPHNPKTLPPPYPSRRQRRQIPSTESKCVLDKLDPVELLRKPTVLPPPKMPHCHAEPLDPPPFQSRLVERRKTKYPSYSEYCRKRFPDLPPLDSPSLKPSICEAWRYYHRDRKQSRVSFGSYA